MQVNKKGSCLTTKVQKHLNWKEPSDNFSEIVVWVKRLRPMHQVLLGTTKLRQSDAFDIDPEVLQTGFGLNILF